MKVTGYVLWSENDIPIIGLDIEEAIVVDLTVN